jgi:hypothetical protein
METEFAPRSGIAVPNESEIKREIGFLILVLFIVLLSPCPA